MHHNFFTILVCMMMMMIRGYLPLNFAILTHVLICGAFDFLVNCFDSQTGS